MSIKYHTDIILTSFTIQFDVIQISYKDLPGRISIVKVAKQSTTRQLEKSKVCLVIMTSLS